MVSEPTAAEPGGSQVDPGEPGLVARAEARADEVAGRLDKSDWIELVSALLLALATISAAWCAYQSTRWGGEQAHAYALAGATRQESIRASSQYFGQVVIDVQVFQSWVTAKNAGDERLAAFWRERFRAEFVPALDAWLATAPAGAIPSGTPFAMPEYQPEQKILAAELEAQAEGYTGQARQANQTGDNFVLLAVVFASVLFFAGVGTRFKGYRVRVIMICFAVVMFAGGLIAALSLPQNVGWG